VISFFNGANPFSGVCIFDFLPDIVMNKSLLQVVLMVSKHNF
jgi:hypothetical protein